MRSPTTSRRAWTVVAAAALAAVACEGGPDGAPDTRRALPEEGRGVQAVTPARYVTDVTFVPFSAGARRLHYSFRHLATSDRLTRDYGGWSLDGEAWRPLLLVRDTVPVPRAGWRVLPAAGLRVVAARGGALSALARQDSSGRVRLELGRTLAQWESPTGQTERFRLAALVSGDERRRGIAVERRAALALEAPSPRGLYGFLLVADSTGEGLVILRHGGTPPGRRPPEVDTTAVAYGWTAGGEQDWSDVRLETAGRADAQGDEAVPPPPEGWEIDIPAAGIRGRLTPGPLQQIRDAVGTRPDAEPGASGGGDAGRSVRFYGLSGTLRVHGETRPVRGIGVEAGKP